MKFALFAGLAAASTIDFSDLMALPEWKVDKACQSALAKDSAALKSALDAMPHDAAHNMVRKSLKNYYATVDDICHDTDEGFYCPNGKEDEMWSAYNKFVYSIRAAKSPQAYKVYSEVVNVAHTMQHCAKLVDGTSILLKFEVSPEGQKEITSEWEDVVVEYRKFEQSKYAHKISEDLEAWSETPQFKAYQKVNQDFAESKEGKKFSEEVLEAIQEIDKNTHVIPNGIQIDNAGLDRIVDELADVDAEYFKMIYNGWGEKLDNAWDKAAENSHFKDAVGEAVEWAKTDDAEDFGQELEEFSDSLDKNLKISDRPN